MKKDIAIFTLTLFCTLSCLAQESIEKALNNFPVLKKENEIPVLVLGTFHFDFTQNVSDVKGENNFDVYAERRQKELLLLIEKLKAFRPTKIAVEKMLPSQPTMDSLFKAYSAGAWTLGKNEVYQVGKGAWLKRCELC